MPKSNMISWKGKFKYDSERYKNDTEYKNQIEYTKMLIKNTRHFT